MNLEVSALMSDTIKALSDYTVNCTLVIVGVAEDISSLIANHDSIARQIVQVKMPRMDRQELSKIVSDRLNRLGMSIVEDALWSITFLSRGLPYFTHLLGMHAARSAIQARRVTVQGKDVDDGIRAALAEVDQTLKETYNNATVSRKPREETLYEPVLLACALSETDELGKFQQKQVEEPLCAITRGKRYKATTYAFHMNEFCEDKRGRLLDKSGDQNPRYRFRNPMMQPYVILRGLADERIDAATTKRFIPPLQPRLSTDF
jgi:hypothetical protein